MGSNFINYAGESVPCTDTLISECKEILNGINNYPKYRFEELFISKTAKGGLEYSRNNKIWEPLYNNWSKNDYEEGEKEEESQKKKNEVKGIYVFYENDQAQYVGISRKILNRLKSHFLGTTHFQATLVYLMLRDKHDLLHGLYKKRRAELPIFQSERGSLQEEMRKNWKISIIPIQENHKLYLTEILVACHLQTKWNSFETH